MDSRVKAHADIIIRHSTQLRAGQTIGIYASTPAEPLVEAVYQEAIKVGAYPFVRLAIPSLAPFFYGHANRKQLTRVTRLDWAEARQLDVRLYIISDANTRALAGVDPERLATAARARKKLREFLLNKRRWCLTIHPTEAFAQEANMSLADFSDFLYGALYCDRKDPVAAWEKLEKMQERMIRSVKGARTVRITGVDTDLTFSIEGRRFVNSTATHNLPSGEIFTAPVDGTAEGTILFDIPTVRDGNRVENIRLRFEKGRVVEATAERGQEYLRKMLKMDAGAPCLGELGIGTNYGITRPCGDILLDEKIGGTVHLALGSAYPECGGKNKSSLHWDMIKDLRGGKGKILIDGRAVQIPRV